MEMYESPTIEPVGGGEPDPKFVVLVVTIAVMLAAVYAQIVLESAYLAHAVSVYHTAVATKTYQYNG